MKVKELVIDSPGSNSVSNSAVQAAEWVSPIKNETTEYPEIEDTDPLEMRVLLLEVSRALVDHPDLVRVDEAGSDASTVILKIFTEPTDVGKILGKTGTTIKAIRELFAKIAAVEGKKIIVEVNDPKKSNTPPRRTRSS